MPQWVFRGTYPQTVAQVFAVLCRPENRLRLAPETLHLRLLTAPERLQKGSRMTLRSRRAGFTQTMELDVTDFVDDVCFVEQQVRGPFRSWRHRYQVEATPEGLTQLTETIDYEPPGGVLGLLATAEVIERDLRQLYEQREPLLRQLLAEANT